MNQFPHSIHYPKQEPTGDEEGMRIGNAYGTPLKLGRVLNVKEIWHLVQEEVEKKYLSDKKEYSNSADLWKDEIGKKIDGLQQKLYKKPAVFSALNSGRVAHSWQHDQRSCFFQVTPPCPTPLVDALTIERFDNGSLTQRNNKTEVLRDFNIHESYNKDHAASCPTLDEQCNFVAGATQTDNLTYQLLYNHLYSSNSSSTSGVIDVDFSSSSSRSQDGQKKRKDFIRSSHKFESDSQTSQSMESNPENGTSLPRQRSPSFRAAIESRSNIHLLPIGDDAQINRKSSNYLTATQYQSNNHNEFIQCSRNRSLSFQAAIEDGQHSPIDTNDMDVISTSADATPDNPNLAEGFTPDMYGKIMLSSGRTDSRSVNFQLNTIETDFRTEPLTSGNISQSLKSSDDLHSCHGSLPDEWKKTLRTGLNQEIEVSVTYASPSTSFDSSGSDVPKKSCIRDSSLLRNGSNTEGVQIVNASETSFKTSKAPEGELEMSPKKHLQSRNMRKLGVHSLEFSKETILQDENADSNSLKVANNKDTVICTQKQQEINSASKATEETAVNKISGTENTDVTKNSKPDDISNHSLGTSDNTSQLSKLREPPCLTSNETNSTLCLKVLRKKDNNLARKREQMKHMKMPELTELAENASDCNDTSKANAFSLTNTFLQPPAPSDSMVLPSISDAFLMELGVFVDQYANFGSEDLTEQETENKFLSLSLAFKTDKQTLSQRLQIQKNSRDLAEDNVEKELKSLREASESLLQLSNDPQIRDAVKNIQHYIDVLEQAVARISGRAEVFGAVQQEERMSRAMEIMMSYVENLKRIREREHLELEEAKTLIDNKILNPEAGGDSSTLTRRATSLSNVPSKNTHRFKALTATSIAMASAAKMMETTKRRASVAAVSKNPTPGGSVPGNPTSMQTGIKEKCTEHKENEGIMNKQEVYHRRSTLPAGKLLRRVNSFEKDQDPYEDSNDKEITHRDHSLEQTLDETKEEKEENDFQVGFRRGLAIKMDDMFEGLMQQQSNLVQHVQNMMVKSDLENASDVKL
eukprot:XP_014777495.1 PREDICTED: uncharacterized protein LOC106874321 [Octopus bimaculoides]